MRRLVALGALATVLLVACNPGARDAEPFQGNWQSETWGTYISVNGGSVEIFEYSAVHCFSIASGGARGINDVLSLEGEVLVLTDAGRTVRLDRIDFLPEACVGPVADDPVATFDVLAATIEEHFFPGIDVGWESRVEALRPVVTATDDELFESITSLLGPLDRPDVRLAGRNETWVAAPAAPVEFPEAEASAGGGILAGSLGDGIAYLAFRRFGDFAGDSDDSERAAAEAIDSSVAAGESLVLDLRASDGGSIDHAMLVASRIVPEQRVVATLSARGPDRFSNAGDVMVRPLPSGTFEGRIAVLVGSGTVGVAELLVAALEGVDGVTIIGQPTAGSPGPGMVRFLPNGWSVGFPNLTATLADGTDLAEGVIPNLLTADALAEALEILRS